MIGALNPLPQKKTGSLYMTGALQARKTPPHKKTDTTLGPPPQRDPI